MKIRPKNWGDFQHYKDRDPTWIKLHKRLLDDYEFQSLPLASRALAPMLWLLASEDKTGLIDADDRKLAFRLRMKPAELEDAIRPLIAADFFEVVQGAIKPLAKPERVDSPEKKEERREQGEEQGREIARSAVADELTLAVEAYNAAAQEVGWPVAEIITDTRKAKLRKRMAECGGLDGWCAAMAKARASPFLRGESGRDKAHEKWVPGLNFFLQQDSFTKLREGQYDDRNSNQDPRGLDAIVAAARAVAAQ